MVPLRGPSASRPPMGGRTSMCKSRRAGWPHQEGLPGDAVGSGQLFMMGWLGYWMGKTMTTATFHSCEATRGGLAMGLGEGSRDLAPYKPRAYSG
jgi:hypothetical protein